MKNPFRYRGYYYDVESGLYYVTSRYYEPETGRFLNADKLDEVNNGNNHILENNLFAYCFNNPLNMKDSEGTWPQWTTNLVKIGIGALAIGIGVAATIATGGAAAPVLLTSISIAVSSAAIGAASGAGVEAVGHRISTGSWKGSGKAAIKGAVNGAADGFMWGGISAGITFTTVAVKGIKIQQISRLKPSGKSGNGYPGVKYKAPKANGKYTTKSIELHSPHRGGPHNRWHWQKNTWNPFNNSITGKSLHWALFGRRF